MTELFDILDESSKFFSEDEVMAVTTYRSSNTREISYMLKYGNNDAIRYASKKMSKLIDSNSILVPITSSKGNTESNLKLAKAIAKRIVARVENILHRIPSESLHNKARHQKWELAKKEGIKKEINIKPRDRDIKTFSMANMPLDKEGGIIYRVLWLKSGVDVNAKNKNGETALIWAANQGYEETVEILKKYGAKK